MALVLGLVASACSATDEVERATRSLEVSEYADKVRGAWQATMFANHSGLDLQGIWLDEPGPDGGLEFLTPEQWSTDDDTHVEWVDLHILETYGIDPTYEQIRDEWVDHLNNDIWISARVARDLMDNGVLPPDTGSPDLNQVGTWSIGAQLQTEVFGMLSPGLPAQARERAEFFARVTNSGPAVDASAFYAHLYAEAFLESDLQWLLDRALAVEPEDSLVAPIVRQVRSWHNEHLDDWRTTRQLIRDAYDTDPEWWASRVNFAVTIMALLYGQGELLPTLTIAGLAGWDADNNMTAAAGLLGIISGFDGLPELVRTSSDVYFNQDVTGDLPMFESVTTIADRTRRLGEAVLFDAGATKRDDRYLIPVPS